MELKFTLSAYKFSNFWRSCSIKRRKNEEKEVFSIENVVFLMKM